MEFGDLLDIIEKYPAELQRVKKEYMYLLSTLTYAPEISENTFLTQVKKISEYGSILIVYKIKENQVISIIGSGTLIVEPKLIHSGKSVAHIEDVVVHPDHRNKGISGKILEYLKRLAVTWNCYKIILDCAPALKPVYEKSGFRQKSVQMAYYIENEIDMGMNASTGIAPLIAECPVCSNIIKRNGFSKQGDINLFIYFTPVQEDIPFNKDVEQDKICEVNKILDTRSEVCDVDRAKILYIINVLDLTQKFKIVPNQNVIFVYISTISSIKGDQFEWEKDNIFLDKIIAGNHGFSMKVTEPLSVV